jgi:hypothetical protein
MTLDRLCGLMARVPGYISRAPGWIPSTTRVWDGVHSALRVQLRSYLKEKVRIRCSDHTTPFLRKSWYYLRRQAVVARVE